MRPLADLHISPLTVEFLRSLGHDVVRVSEIAPANTEDEAIIAIASQQERVILTQDLDFSDLIALAGKKLPSVISLRLSSSRIEYVNQVLQRILPDLEQDVLMGMIIAVKDRHIRRRRLPIT